MISLGTVRWTSSSPEINLTLAYEKKRSGADMQYRASITVSPVTGSSYFGYPIYLNLSIDNALRVTATLKEANPSQWTTEITYTSPWYTISNKTSGTVPIAFNVYSGSGSTRTGTYSASLAVDPAESTISASGGTLGEPLTLNITRHDSSHIEKITYTCGAKTGSVANSVTSDTVTWDTNNGNTVALASESPSGSIVPVTFDITTYRDGTVVGTSSTTVFMNIPSSVKPSVELSVTDATGLADVYGAYIRDHSKIAVTLTPTLAYGSPIKQYLISAGGVTSYDTPSITTDVIKTHGTVWVNGQVVDERGRPSELVKQSVTVLYYAKPSVTLKAYRCNSVGTADPEGEYMRIILSSSIVDLNAKNSASYVITYKDDSGETVTISGDGKSYSSAAIACDISSTRTVRAVVTDDLSSVTVSTTVPVAFTLMDYYHTGKGVAFGKVATRDGFDCAMGAYFGGNRLQEVGSPTADTDAVNRAYVLSMLPTADADYPGCYYRMAGDEKEWLNPPMQSNVEYRTTERWKGKPVYTKIVPFGALPNATAKNVSWSPDSGTAAQVISAVAVSGTGGMLNLIDSANTSSIWIVTTDDYSSQTADVVLKYTKL